MAPRRKKTYRAHNIRSAAVLLISLMLVVSAFVPAMTHAWGVTDFTDFIVSITKGSAHADTVTHLDNVQTLTLPQPALNINPSPARGGGDVTIVDDTALLPAEGPSGTLADIERSKNTTISTYIVRPGDTISDIAALFDVSVNTVLWANDLRATSKLRVGQTLVILPITGVKYTVQKGDTLALVAKKFGGDPDEIANSNGIEGSLAAGDEIIIPDGEIAAAPAPAKKPTVAISVSTKAAKTTAPAHDVGPRGSASENSYYTAPLSHYIRTQGIHGYNSVDLGAPVGTPILASATGDVVVARQGGWNGGYGNYVVVEHSNGSQTLYAHASEISVGNGDHVVQGQVIGYVGQTGKATGPHLHFEIRNGVRNPF